MAYFRFKAYDSGGVLREGTLEAASEKAALEQLAQSGRFPTEIVPAADGGEGNAVPAPAWWQREIGRARPLSIGAQAALTRELATLIKAQIPIDETLRIVAAQPRLGARARRVVAMALARVMEGEALSAALTAEPGAVPEHIWRLIRAGEAGGALPQVLDEAAGFLEQAQSLRSSTLTAMLYPMVLLAAALATFGVITLVMVPAVVPLFRDAGVAPPILLGALASLQEALSNHWPVATALVAGLVASLVWASRSEAWRASRDRLVLRLPLIGRLTQCASTARLSRTLAMLLKNGVPMIDALRATAGVVANRAFQSALIAAAAAVNRGSPLSEPLAGSGLLPDLAVRLLRIGEQTGQLAPMLARAADIYEHDMRQRLQRVLSIAAPLITIGIGLAIGTLILSVMGAMLGLNEAVLK